MEWLTAVMWFKRHVKVSDQKQAAVYEWVVESLTQPIRSIAINHLGMKQAAVYEWVVESPD